MKTTEEEPIDQILAQAAAKAWRYLGPNVRNESDFKHELYHQLAVLEVGGTKLNELVPGTPSCRLHAETKIEVGKNAKADLSICEPSESRKFNYQVRYALELKKRLDAQGVRAEIKKFASYASAQVPLYLVSALPCTPTCEALIQKLRPPDSKISLLAPPARESESVDTTLGSADPIDSDAVRQVIQSSVDLVLNLYGKGRAQYHGFFWCNYTQEVNKDQTYPCEGDFVCQLYHRLRSNLPPGVKVLTEYTTFVGSRKWIDLVVTDGTTAFPIEVKMNWDQFEHRRVDDRMQEIEASTIVSRFRDLGEESSQVEIPTVVVVQLDLRQKSNRREEATGIFDAAPFALELVGYSEDKERIVRQVLGTSPSE